MQARKSPQHEAKPGRIPILGEGEGEGQRTIKFSLMNPVTALASSVLLHMHLFTWSALAAVPGRVGAEGTFAAESLELGAAPVGPGAGST